MYIGVGTIILKCVSPDFIENTDPATFLLLIDDRPTAFFFDHLHCRVELRSTITLYRSKNVAGKALRVNSNECRHIRFHLAFI